MKLKYFGHACFSLEANSTTLFFDPFLKGNTFNIAQPEDVKADYILVTHAHGDHIGDTVEIAKASDALIISTAEIAGQVGGQGCKAHAMHIGGKYNFDFGYVRVTPAFHGAGIPGGHACGFIVKFFDKVIYHAGDTSLFSDMKLLGELENIDYALLPIGSNFTMGPEDAVIAAKFIKAKHVVPMHYNTWPIIAQDPSAYVQAVNDKGYAQAIEIKPGEIKDI